MTNYSLKCSNSTAQGWHYGLYQQQPSEPGLKTIAWKVLALSKPQPNATTGTIPWKLTYQVTIPQTQDGNIYTGGLTVDAEMGYNYELVLEDGYIQIKQSGKGTPGYINFKNNTKTVENMGLMVSGTLMSMQENVTGGVTAQFQVTPTYYCGLFTNIMQGSFVSSDAAVEAIKITFPDGMNVASVSAVIEAGQVALKGPEFSYS